MKEIIAEYIVPVTQDGKDVMFDFLRATMVIRCKDCENWGQDGYREGCKYAVEIMTENDFCSRAEPKEDSDAVGSI